MVEMMYKKCFEFMFGVMEVLGIEGVGLGRVDEGMFRQIKVSIYLWVEVEDGVND